MAFGVVALLSCSLVLSSGWVSVQSFTVLEASTRNRPSGSRGDGSGSTDVQERRVAVFDNFNNDDVLLGTVQASAGGGGGRLPTVLEQIVNERAEFQINLGRAMDALQSDMPHILSRPLDYSIYHDKINLIDPSGVQLTGLSNYKSSLSFLQGFHRFWFQDKAHIQFRMVYDFCRSSIRISWHVVLWPKALMNIGGIRPLHVDGISYYQLDAESGKITQHKIDNLLINNKPAVPPYGILSLLQQESLAGVVANSGGGAPVLGVQ